MNCIKCGAPLKPTDKFCINCGLVVGTEIKNNEVKESEVNTNTINDNLISNENIKKEEILMVNQDDKKSGGKLKYFSMILLALALIAASVVGGLYLITKEDASINSEPEVKKEIIKEVYYKVNHNEFDYFIDENLVYENTDTGLIIGNDLYKIVFETSEGSFDNIKNNRSLIQTEFEGKKYIARVAEERKVNEIDFITIEASKDDINAVISYSKVDYNHFLVATIYSVNNDFIYEPLEVISNIVSRMKYNNMIKSLPNLNQFKTIGAINVGINLQKDIFIPNE